MYIFYFESIQHTDNLILFINLFEINYLYSVILMAMCCSVKEY